MPITVHELIDGIEKKNKFPLDNGQKDAISHGSGPLLIAAGPGTGKTEVLVARCLKFICCDGVDPGSIMLTTFTEKAAKNLEDRLAEGFLSLVSQYPQLDEIDPSNIRVGTLHSLCNDILQEYRYTAYQNIRLLDEMENSLLIHRRVANSSGIRKQELLAQFGYLFRNQKYIGRWDWTLALLKLFNRVVEDQIDLDRLAAEGGAWSALYEANLAYEEALGKAYSCDFAHLLRHFREFLDTGEGETLLEGDVDGANVRPALTHVLVDEYQDTNPIQESIYLRLCEAEPHNITVVGDDDQALYRFRGGTVECMVGFSDACEQRWGVKPAKIFLADNHRSDEEIVRWCNKYITSFPQMNAPNVRIQGKPALSASNSRGTHPAVGLIRNSKVADGPRDMALLVKGLKDHGIIGDYSQCVLLLRSAQNSPRYAGPFQNELQELGIPVYNPRSKDYVEQSEVAECLGAFIRIVDADLTQIGNLRSTRTQRLVDGWVDSYDSICVDHPELAEYVKKAAKAISDTGKNDRISPAMPTILYRILSHKPFSDYQTDPEKDLRLSKLTRLFESFCSQYGRELRTDNSNAGELPGWWYGNFYYGLCGYVVQRGLNDDEDDEEVCPQGYFPIMTVHQAKGLEFDFVFVGNLGGSVRDSDSHKLEEDLRKFRYDPPAVVHAMEDAKWHDEIRLHFVAYSRAKQALVLMASDGQLRKKPHETASFTGQGGGWVRHNIRRL